MLEELREKALALPLKPGVYIMQNSAGEVIYVGKAKALKNRVSSYFHGSHNNKTEAMISNISDFSVIIAASEFEALLLENSLIKHYAPKYNILLKDDKGYPFVRLDLKSDYPRFSITSKRAEDGAEYFGPYGTKGATKSAIEAICKCLKLPTCGKVFPKDFGKERPCLNYHMGVCDAWCRGVLTKEEYGTAINRAVMLLRGKGKELTEELQSQMENAAENLKFEEAAELRDMIRSIAALEKKQYVLLRGSSDTDAIGFFAGEVKCCFAVLHYIQGQLLGKDIEMLNNPLLDVDSQETLSVLVRQYYGGREGAPETVLLPDDTGDVEELTRYLTQEAGHSVRVTVPQRGKLREFITAAQDNAREEVERRTSKEERISKTALWLRDALKLPTVPERVESFDISNTGSDDIVASMVVFYNGRPLKREYKKFKMKTIEGTDDYGSMREAVGRRFRRYTEGDKSFSELPDLLLIDGGAAHASAAKEAMESTGVSVPVFGMVKDDRHRTRALVTPDGQEIGIAAFPAVFSFIGNIQEETHHFAIEYHHALRSKRVQASALDGIAGVGEKRKAALLKQFKSIKAIKEASVEELSKVVPKNTANAIYLQFHTKT